METSARTEPLFAPMDLREVHLKNRIWVSPMCQYSSIDGMATDWHLVHLGSRAVGGAALVMVEATGVEARGRISPDDMGIWDDKHIEPLKRIASFIKGQNCVPAIQIAHAGRKACTASPWKGGQPIHDADAWKPVGPSPIPFAEGFQVPHELSKAEINEIREQFRLATKRGLAAGFEVIEIHSAHGYLLHSFLSPLSNQRSDEYGGTFENRIRFLLEVTKTVRAEIPAQLPLVVRISASDWVDGAWDIEQSVLLAKELKKLGVDLIDCSSGGSSATAKIPNTPGYQVPFAEQIRREAGIMTGAVGLITDPKQANEIIQDGKADVVLLARQMLRDPYWAQQAAHDLSQNIDVPPQYGRARR